MKKVLFGIGLMGVGLLLFTSCQKEDNIHHKFIEGLPINSDETVIPGRAIQEFHLLIRDAMTVIVPIINRLGTYNAGYSELTPEGGMSYSFGLAEKHYRSARVVIQFRNDSDGPVDPITAMVSTSAVRSVRITSFTGSSDFFSFSQTDGRISLDTAGVTGSNKSTTGAFTFNGQGYNIVFTMASPGLLANYQGIYGGSLSAAGTGPTALPFSAQLNYTTDLNMDGNVIWDNRSGGVHFLANGAGYITTDKERFLLD